MGRREKDLFEKLLPMILIASVCAAVLSLVAGFMLFFWWHAH